MLASLTKVKASNSYSQGSILIDQKYYILASNLDSDDTNELIEEMQKIVVKSQNGFIIRMSDMISHFGDRESSVRFMYLMQSMIITESGYGFQIIDDFGVPALKVIGNLNLIIGALAGTDDTAGVASFVSANTIDSELPNVDSVEGVNANTIKVYITEDIQDEMPDTSSFTTDTNEIPETVTKTGDNEITLVFENDITSAVNISYTPGVKKIKDLAGNPCRDFTEDIIA